ncbi:MAG: hypothetical protein ABIP57_09550 [Jatrophihabitantaceae bacterium]
MPRPPIGHLRSHAAAAELRRAVRELSSVQLVESQAPLLYAMRVLASDDRYGATVGLIVQGDELRWASIHGLVDLAIYGNLAHRDLAHAGGAGGDCELCSDGEAMWHNALIHQVVTDRGTTATQLHQRLRAVVERDRSIFQAD